MEAPSGNRLRGKGWHDVLCRLKAVWSMPDRFKVVCIPCKALYKCSAFCATRRTVFRRFKFLLPSTTSMLLKIWCIATTIILTSQHTASQDGWRVGFNHTVSILGYGSTDQPITANCIEYSFYCSSVANHITANHHTKFLTVTKCTQLQDVW